MSSFKEIVLKPVKYRVGFAVVIAVAVLVTALITRSSIAAAIVALGVVIAMGLILDRRRREPTNVGLPPGSPYSVSYRWRTHQKPNLADLSQVLIRNGLVRNIESQTSNEVVLRGGSQLRTRLLGGYFVDHRRLPVRVSLGTEDVGHEEFIVELGVRDRLGGVGIRDGALGDRYAQAATGIRSVIGDQLNALGGREVDSGAPR